MNFGEQLQHLRGRLSQAAAARRAGISQQQWSKLERGVTAPDDSSKIAAIARAWGMSTDELLRGVLPSASYSRAVTETASSYAAERPALEAEDDVIQTARIMWDRACKQNRALALTIAKLIIVVVNGAHLMELQSPPR